MALQHLRSSTAHKRPIPTVMSAGQIAINTNEASPGLFFKDSNGDLVKVGPVHIGTTAPNSSPASVAATALVTGTVYQILTVGTSDFTLVGASANTVGTIFTATGTTTGTGTVSGQQGVEKGEQWLDTTGGTYVLKIYDGTDWRSESGTFVDVSGDTMTGDLVMNNANIVFEGATADDFETTLTVTDPTADRSIVLPDVSGDIVTTGDTGTVTSTMIADGTIVNADVNASAAIAGTKIDPDFGSQTIETTGVFSAADGAAATPSITFTGDTNTGIYRPGADQLAISTNGTGRLFVDSSGNVGVGTSSTSYKVDVRVATNVPTTGSPAAGSFLQIRGDSATVGTGPSLNLANFSGSKETAWRLSAVQTSGNYGDLTFVTYPGGTSYVERMRLDSSGNVKLAFPDGNNGLRNKIAFTTESPYQDETAYIAANRTATSFAPTDLVFATGTSSGTSERVRLDSSGRLLVGTSSSRSNVGGLTAAGSDVQIESAGTDLGALSLINNYTAGYPAVLTIGATGGSTVGSNTIVNAQDDIGQINFVAADGTNLVRAASIVAFVDGTPGTNDMPGRLVFSTTGDGAAAPTERMRIDKYGYIYAGRVNTDRTATGLSFETSFGVLGVTSSTNRVLDINRQGNDGDLILFFQGSSQEGSISVSGTTVSYNGAHLSRWSQLPNNAERIEILRGTVLSNIDEMCEWSYDAEPEILWSEDDELPDGVSVGDVKTPAKDAGIEDNEQLNRMKVSDVEGDRNVSGVFQAWDDDDDTYTNDFYCAMTGDFVIRIAQGTTVARGDLLMSAGDGTAKPQNDDIVRSKTIAKVTSTVVSETYSDGSYCVPCVLMAC